MKYPVFSDQPFSLDQRRQAGELVRNRGTNKRPSPPRGLIAQSGSRKCLVTWEFPPIYKDIVGWNIYKGTESQKLDTIKDPNTRQYAVDCSAGAAPPTVNIYISSVNALGIESQKVQVQGKATAEAGAPMDPSPLPGTAASGDAGATGASDGSTSFPHSSGGGFVTL
jgi:hypothetical protein